MSAVKSKKGERHCLQIKRLRCRMIKYIKYMKIQSKGFTVPELASATAFISILAALSYPLVTNLVARTEYAAAKLALSSLQRKCEAINMLGISGTAEKVNIRGYKIKTSNGSREDVSELCKSRAIVFISEKESRPSLYYNVVKGGSGCLVSGKHLNSYPECKAKESTSLAQAINSAGNLIKTKGSEYYSFGANTGARSTSDGAGGNICDKKKDPNCL